MLTTGGQPYWVVLVAHGDTLKNQEHRHGSGMTLQDEWPTETGKRQAKAAAEFIIQLIFANSSCDTTGVLPRWLVPVWAGTTFRLATYGVRLRRALESMIYDRSVASLADIYVLERIRVQLRLNAMDMGLFSAKTKEEMRAIDPESEARIGAWVRGLGPPPDMPDGERADAFFLRYKDGFTDANDWSVGKAGWLGRQLVHVVVCPGSGTATAHHIITAPDHTMDVKSIPYRQGHVAAYYIHDGPPEALTPGFVDPAEFAISAVAKTMTDQTQ